MIFRSEFSDALEEITEGCSERERERVGGLFDFCDLLDELAPTERFDFVSMRESSDKTVVEIRLDAHYSDIEPDTLVKIREMLDEVLAVDITVNEEHKVEVALYFPGVREAR